MSQQEGQSRESIIMEYREMMQGLAEICEKYADTALNLQLVFTQLKNQSKQAATRMDAQLKLQAKETSSQQQAPVDQKRGTKTVSQE